MYDFSSLSDIDFEILTQDLLQEELKLIFEGFKKGKDKGIDLRCLHSGNNIIVQCKHYVGSSFSALYSNLKKELPKIEKLNPQKYIIVTSHALTPDNKDKIKKLFEPYIINLNDIYGKEDLNNLLKLHPNVEINHFKLWMTNTQLLNKIFKNRIINQTSIKLDEIKEKIKKFVPNSSFKEAKSILNNYNCVVISGSPGVGKTTLSDIIVWEYILNDYEFIYVTNDIKDALECFNPKSKQIFYYDDFLGETSLFSKNEDAQLIAFIKKIQNSSNKKFILTTREYVFQKAKVGYEKINEFDFNNCVIDLKKYTKSIKAKILYNHLYFSKLPKKYIISLLSDEFYMKIIEHENYNPRIIEYMTRDKICENIAPEKYNDLFIESLNKPLKIYEYAFENQLSDVSRSILFGLSFLINNKFAFDNNISEIEDVAQKINEKLYHEKFSHINFRKSLKILLGDFIDISENNIKFANPSVKDFMEYEICKNSLLPIYIDISKNCHQNRWIFNLALNNYADKENMLRKLYKKICSNNFHVTYGFWEIIDNLKIALEIIIELKDIKMIEKINDFLNFILYSNYEFYHLSYAFNTMNCDFLTENDIIKNFLFALKEKYFDNIDLYEDVNSDEYAITLGNFASKFRCLFSDEEYDEIIKFGQWWLDAFIDNCPSEYYDVNELSSDTSYLEEILNAYNLPNTYVDSFYDQYYNFEDTIENDNITPDNLKVYIEHCHNTNIIEMFNSLKDR